MEDDGYKFYSCGIGASEHSGHALDTGLRFGDAGCQQPRLLCVVLFSVDVIHNTRCKLMNTGKGPLELAVWD